MATTTYKQRKTPGVYVTEINAFPPSVVGIETAVPAFIGYTQKAEIGGKPVSNKPIRIRSLMEYEQIFGGPFVAEYIIEEVGGGDVVEGRYDFKVRLPADPDPEPGPLPASTTSATPAPAPAPAKGDKKGSQATAAPSEAPVDDGHRYYRLKPETEGQFCLYNSLRLFYANGGGDCYVVSVGSFDAPNAKVELDPLKDGLGSLEQQSGPTMVVVPDAMFLDLDGVIGTPPAPTSSAYNQLATAVLQHCGKLQDRIAILDVYGASKATPENLSDLITAFQAGVGSNYLNYGMAYFPMLHTSVVQLSEINYRNLAPDSVKLLKDILRWENQNVNGTSGKRFETVKATIERVPDEGGLADAEALAINQDLAAALPLIIDIERVLARQHNLLPPSAAMAGVFAYNDSARGVWNAPANVSLNGVIGPSARMDDSQQGELNLPVNGKAINGLREFAGQGTVVWGARTLDGNSNDWRYIQVRRTLIYIEQSVKAALRQFVFAPNDGGTWVAVSAMISSFLQGLWTRGGLMGATAAEAYNVACGLGQTMTADDVLNGYMIVQVRLQMIRPAEFIELTFEQKMEASGG